MSGKSIDIYLQGSYANSTNIKVDSDIDVVVQLNSTFHRDISKLSFEQKALYESEHSNATYRFEHFRKDVIQALMSHFGATDIELGNKCIKIDGNSKRVNADVIPCLHYRDYQSFTHSKKDDYVEGIKLVASDGIEIINHPKLHIENSQHKNAEHRTSEKYKHAIRVLKNIKRKLAESNNINSDIAPSYFIECSVYNVPDNYFHTDLQTTIHNILHHIINECDPNTMLTASHQHNLFGEEDWKWNTQDASTFFNAVSNYFYNN